jgi:4-carboxymuconolactone decarboxylase
MRGQVNLVIVLTWTALAASVIPFSSSAKQSASGQSAGGTFPRDVDPDSRSRLPALKRDDLDERGRKAYDDAVRAAGSSRGLEGAAAIRLHASGVSVRWASPVGRPLTELAILTTAREHDQPYEWSLHEMEAVAVGLNPSVINIVRHRNRIAGAAQKEAVIIQMGREIFGRHQLSSDTYARGLKLFGKRDLVDIVDLMAGYSGTATRLTAFNQLMPPGWKQFLPLPFTPSDDIHPDSRSRLPLIRSQGQAASPNLYSRQLAPEGTGPGHIGRHGRGLQSLEASVGRRMMGVAILVTAREHDAQYEWTVNEIAALKDGLEPRVIDSIRHRRPVNGLGLAEQDAAVIEFGRELFGKHNVSPETYARALKALGERDLVDLVSVMAQQSSDAALTIAFDQRLPDGQKPLLPIP